MTVGLLLGTALAAPAPPMGESPRLYLDESTVREELHAHLPSLAPCFDDLKGTEAEYGLTLTIGRDGVGRGPVLDPEDLQRQACLEATFAGLPFSPHHEDPLAVRTILVWRAQGLVPHPMVALPERPPALLFLYVSDPLEAAGLEAALRTPLPED